MQQNFKLHTSTGCNMFVNQWIPSEAPKGIVLILHGMAEHSARYANFAEHLNKQGFTVYAPDQRGHGQTVGNPNKLGFLDENEGWYKMLEDLNNLHQRAQADYPNKPVFLLGHSMGSMVVRHYLQQYPDHDLNGAVVIATAGDQGVLRMAGLALSHTISLLFGKRTPSPLMNFMSFGAYNNKFRPNRTAFDWLNRDEANVDAYIADPYCGTVFPAGFWSEFLSAMGDFSSPARIRNASRRVPMLWLAGTMDPVGNFSKGVSSMVARYRKLGFDKIELKTYEGARHELLNEINREEVYADISAWLIRKIPTTE